MTARPWRLPFPNAALAMMAGRWAKRPGEVEALIVDEEEEGAMPKIVAVEQPRTEGLPGGPGTTSHRSRNLCHHASNSNVGGGRHG